MREGESPQTKVGSSVRDRSKHKLNRFYELVHSNLCDVKPRLFVPVLATDLKERVFNLTHWWSFWIIKSRIGVIWGILLHKQMRILVRPRPAVLSKQSYLFVFKYLVVLMSVVAQLAQFDVAASCVPFPGFRRILLPEYPRLHEEHPWNADQTYH